MSRSPSRFAVVLNAKSRSGAEQSEKVQQFLGDRPEFVRLTNSVEQQTAAIERAVDAGCDAVWIGGGDGSVRLAAEQLVGSMTTLAILPFGTGNSLARELGIPLECEKAVTFHLEEAEVRPIDVGRFQDDVFVNVATIGLTSKIVEKLESAEKGKFGRWVYLPALIKAIQAARSFQIQVETATECFAGRALQFVAASTRLHGGPFAVTADASINDGLLSIYVVRKGDKAAILRYGLALMVGKHTDLPNVWSVNTAQAHVRLARPGDFIIDGEPMQATDVGLGIYTRALLVSAKPV